MILVMILMFYKEVSKINRKDTVTRYKENI